MPACACQLVLASLCLPACACLLCACLLMLACLCLPAYACLLVLAYFVLACMCLPALCLPACACLLVLVALSLGSLERLYTACFCHLFSLLSLICAIGLCQLITVERSTNPSILYIDARSVLIWLALKGFALMYCLAVSTVTVPICLAVFWPSLPHLKARSTCA